MSRLRRWFVEGLSLHVHQRGNNRTDIFGDTRDRLVLVMALLEASNKFGVAIHAWVLMQNHFHLLATPQSPESIPRMMQQVGRRYVPFFNKRYERTGGLWEGRYSAHLVDSEAYWFRCARYIELNPVRATMVTSPNQYRWSSHQSLGLGRSDPLVTPHALYTGLGETPLERQAAHRALCGTPLDEVELVSIRNALRTGLSGASLPESCSLAIAS